MFSTKFILFVSFGLCIFVSTVFGQSDNGDQENGGNGRRGGFGRFHGSGSGNRFRSYKSDLTAEQRQELKELKQVLRNGNITKQEKEDQIRSFYEGVGGDALLHYNEKQAKMEAHKEKFNNWISNTTHISDAAKELLTQIAAIKSNMQITKAEERTQIKALYAEASDEVKQELFKGHGFHGFGRKQNGGGGRGRRPSAPASSTDENALM